MLFFSLFKLYKPMFKMNKSILKRNTYMTKSRWQNEYDRIMTMMNINIWTWQMFFSCRRAKQGWAGVPASVSLWAGPGGTVQANRTSIFLGVKLMFVIIVFFSHVQSLRFVVVNNFWSCSNPNFGHIYLVLWISLILNTKYKKLKFSWSKVLHFFQGLDF